MKLLLLRIRLSVLVLVLACGTNSPAERVRPQGIEVRVVNDFSDAVRVYLASSTGYQSIRLMNVNLRGTVFADLPTGNWHVLVVPASSRYTGTWLSDPLYWVQEGDCIEVRVKPYLPSSTVMIC